jgi:hypothetical protein
MGTPRGSVTTQLHRRFLAVGALVPDPVIDLVGGEGLADLVEIAAARDAGAHAFSRIVTAALTSMAAESAATNTSKARMPPPRDSWSASIFLDFH